MGKKDKRSDPDPDARAPSWDWMAGARRDELPNDGTDLAMSSITSDEPGPGEDDLALDSGADVAPVGPTEHASGPESIRTPVSTGAPASTGSPAGAPVSTGSPAGAPVSTGSPAGAPSAGGGDEATGKPGASVEQLAQQIKDLEARLDEMIAGSHRDAGHSRAPVKVADANADAKPGATAGEARPRATARDLLPEDYYLRQWGRAGLRQRAEEVDDFGHDPKYEARFLPFFDFLYKTYFRVETSGIENVPTRGRCLVVSNHSGGPLPYDGIMLRTTLRNEQVPRELRWLAEDFVYHLPFIGTAMNRLGAVRACQENAERLLAQGKLVAVFPEGAKGIGKLFRDRYKLQRFGRGGFIRLCLRTRTPIVPVAIVGAEEANPMLYRIEYMTKTLGVPYLPITPTFPVLGPLGLLPAPTKWKVTFGEPVDFAAYGPEAADDELLVGRLAERVRATIQGMLDRAIERRRSVWFG